MAAKPDIRVSFIVPCYNSARWLRETMVALTAQTLTSAEIIVVDDGSRDTTRALIADLIGVYPGHDIQAIFQDNAGVAAARNRGIVAARGQYILPVDADDLIAPEMAEVCAAVLDSEPALSLVYTDREEFGAVTAIRETGPFELQRLKYFNQLSYCALYRKSMWEAVGGYRTNVNGFDDWDFWIATAALGFQGRRVPRALLRHRKRPDSQITDVVKDYARLFATIILNNRAVYAASEIAAAEAFLETGVAGPLLRSSRFVFMGHYLGKLPATDRREEQLSAF